MALTNSPPINLLAIQNEFSAYGLLAAASAAGVSANMLAFLGKSSAPTYSWGTYPSSINEGTYGTFNVNTTNVPNGTQLRWQAVNLSGSDAPVLTNQFAITSNTGAFTISITADNLTEGTEYFTVEVYTLGGALVLTSNTIAINDTSLNQEFTFYRTFSSDTTNYNVLGDAYFNGWDGVKPVKALININSWVTIGATFGYYAFSTGSGFPAGSSIDVFNFGTIAGYGAAGGSGGTVYAANNLTPGSPGGTGGTALYVTSAITIYNYGIIGGGGGGGGGGGAGYATDFYIEVLGAGGGGGGGQGSSHGYGVSGVVATFGYPPGSQGGHGTIYGPGGGGAGTNYNNGNIAIGGTGGSGGALGGSGANGGGGYYYPGLYGATSAGGAGGSGGYAVAGNSYINWEVTGTRYGTII